MTAQAAGARAQVENVIGVADGVFVVLNDQHRVAQVAQLLKRLDEAVVVALVQADGRLVEHIKHAAQSRADLRGQPDALALAAGERRGIAVEREIVETDGAEKFKALHNLAANAFGDQRLTRVECEIDGRGERAIERTGQ